VHCHHLQSVLFSAISGSSGLVVRAFVHGSTVGRRLLTGSFVKPYVTKRSLYTEEDLLWHAGELYTIHLDVQLTAVVLLEFASSLSLICIAFDFAALLSNSQA
jgi:hypothetical protein